MNSVLFGAEWRTEISVDQKTGSFQKNRTGRPQRKGSAMRISPDSCVEGG